MHPQIPRTAKQWTVQKNDGLNGLRFSEADIPALGDSEVLVRIHAASINYRDIRVIRGEYSSPVIPSVVPGSDGAGQVVAIGKRVHRFQVGDKVCTLFNQQHFDGPLTTEIMASGLGGGKHGVFREYGAFDQNGLVAMPDTLSYLQASALPCAALTAWNALFGLTGRHIQPGQWVLTQGTGGVSIFAVQFAKFAGARVIATTSSLAKARLLERLGADCIINYNEEPQWGAVAKKVTGGAGVDQVIEVAGPSSMAQSLEAVKVDGLINIVGFVAGKTTQQPGFLECLTKQCIARGLLVGSRSQFEDMNRAISSAGDKLTPIIDPRVFKLEDLREALEYQLEGKHQGKICIDMA